MTSSAGIANFTATRNSLSSSNSGKVKKPARRRKRKQKPNQFIVCDEWSVDTGSVNGTNETTDTAVPTDMGGKRRSNPVVPRVRSGGDRLGAHGKRKRGGQRVNKRNAKYRKTIQKGLGKVKQEDSVDSLEEWTVLDTVESPINEGLRSNSPFLFPPPSVRSAKPPKDSADAVPKSSNYSRRTHVPNRGMNRLDNHAPSHLMPPTSRSNPSSMPTPLPQRGNSNYHQMSRDLLRDDISHPQPMERIRVSDLGPRSLSDSHFCSNPPVHFSNASPTRPTRQLKISSFLSPKKSSENLIERLPQISARSSLPGPGRALPKPFSLGVHVEDHAARMLPPRQVPDYDPPLPTAPSRYHSNEVQISHSVSTALNVDSVFSRLGSPAKLRQSRLMFTGASQQQRSSSHIPIGNLSLPPNSLVGSMPAPPVVKLEPELDPPLVEAKFHSMHSSAHFSISGTSSSRLARTIPEENSSLYRYQPRTGVPKLDMTKLVNRYGPKEYHMDSGDRRVISNNTSNPGPTRKGTTMQQGSSSRVVNEITENRVVEVVPKTVSIQVPGSSQTGRSSILTLPRSVQLNDTNAGFSDTNDTCDDVDYVRCVEDSNRVKIPVSKMGLKVVAIDCEMVGCMRTEKLQPEVFLANNLRGGGAEKRQVKKGGLFGVLQKTKMKPQALTKKKAQSKNKEISVAARCSIIGYDGSVLYDKYINPSVGTGYKIIAYRTPWSGIRPQHMVGATPFKEAREEVLDILSNCVVIGHHIWSDLHALEINTFPAERIRDTSIYPTLKKRAGLAASKQPGALKKMSLSLLGRHIQTRSRVGHCSVEDATATMDLYKLVEEEWET